jgi:hypothetical protein
MALLPSKPSDGKRLKELGHNGYVFPLDEALGLARLPFKMTIAAMLEIARETARSNSYMKKRSRGSVNALPSS